MIVVINLGLKSVRSIVFSYDGMVQAQASEPIHTYVSNESVEQDPREWERLTKDVVRKTMTELGDAAQSIEYVAVTTSASCLVAVDGHGTPTRNSVLVSDTRSTEQARLLANTFEFRSVLADTGLSPSPDLMLPKMMWIKRHEPEVLKATKHFMNVGDYLVALLTGRYVTDPNNASKFHHAAGIGYPNSLLDSLGLDPKGLPAVENAGTSVGKVLPEIATELGLPTSTEVILATYDALAAVTGTGAFEVGEAVDVSGTVTSFRVVTDHHVHDPEGRVYVNPHLDGTWLIGGSNNLGGGIVEWLKQLFFAGDDDPYGAIEAEAASEQPCPGGLIFLPYLLGERAPKWDPDCRGVFFGLNRAHGRPQMVRAVLESIGFSVRDIATVLKSFMVEPHVVNVSGGLARIDLANQIKADILGVPVQRLSNFETTSIGAALIALSATNVFSSPREGFSSFCRIDRVFEPNPAVHMVYDEYFELYRSTYDALRPVFEQRKRIIGRLSQVGISELTIAENL